VTKPHLVIALLIILLVLGAGAFGIWYQLRRQSRLTERLEAIRQTDHISLDGSRAESITGIASVVAALGSAVASSGLLSRNTIAGLERTLVSTGIRGSSALGLFLGMKVLMLLFMPVLTLVALLHFDVSPMMRNLGTAGSALVGLLGPDWYVGWKYQRYLSAITFGLADALDLMVICAEAGLSFEPAMSRVAHEIRAAHPAVSQEFGQTASEFRVVADSKIALNNMGTRTNLDGIKRMTQTLAQTLKYGTPLSDALRVLSAEMRHEMLIRYETRAARLPVLLTIPMILFILPCIFLIVGGPAVIQVMHSLRR
jgi:tight adherence protein C